MGSFYILRNGQPSRKSVDMEIEVFAVFKNIFKIGVDLCGAVQILNGQVEFILLEVDHADRVGCFGRTRIEFNRFLIPAQSRR